MGWSKKNSVWQLHRDPLASARLLDWFDAGQGITLNGGNVSQWGRVVGSSGLVVAQSNSSLQPSYVASSPYFGGKPAILLADSKYLRSGAYDLNQPFTIYVVARFNSMSNNGFLTDGIDGSGRCCFYCDSGAVKMYAGAIFGDVANNASITTCVYTLEFNVTNSKLFRNNSTTPIATGNVSSMPMHGLHFGSYGASPLEYSANAYLSEWLRYSGTHDAATRKSIMDYLGGKYGIATT